MALLVGLLALLAASCAPQRGRTSPEVREPRLWECDAGERPLQVPRGSVVVVLTHGNRAGPAEFRVLAQAIRERPRAESAPPLVVGCFRFSQGARLTNAAVTLRQALRGLERQDPSRVMLLGHSVGGLVARRALVADARLPPLHTPVDLVTVATPFAGVASARACGEGPLRIVSLGVTALICRAHAGGSRWRDIHPRASLINSPGALGRWVGQHLNVVTWERGRCRVAGASGVCRVSDDVFGTAEQMSPAIADARLITRVLRAGHVAAIQDRRASARLAAMMSDVH